MVSDHVPVSYTHLIVINNSTLEQVSRFKYLGCAVSYESEYDRREKINKFRNICSTIHRNIRKKNRAAVLKAVSYTHLDVYKRQVLISSLLILSCNV